MKDVTAFLGIERIISGGQTGVDRDATLILYCGEVRGGTALTRGLAQRCARPLLVLDLNDPGSVGLARAWLARHRLAILNVAGPRESQHPGVQRAAAAWLGGLFAAIR